MVIVAKFASRCGACGEAIPVGARIEWAKGSPARHATCAATAPAPRGRGRNWNPDRFNGYGAARGGYSRVCKTDGNCSSFGSGKSCGGHDCDGY